MTKSLFTFAVLVLVSVVAFVFGANADRERQPERVKFDRIEAREIVVKSGNGRHSIVLASFPDGVGVWVSDGDGNGRHAAVVSMDGQGTWIGLNANNAKGCPVALSLDEKNRPQLQLATRHDSRFVDLFSLLDFKDE